jgi:hypothetical protein
MEEPKSPIKHTLWMDCLFQCMKGAQERGDEQVEFDDVDRLVIARSKSIVEWKCDEDIET